jgi:DNA-binding MarR family transcriptional regulator
MVELKTSTGTVRQLRLFPERRRRTLNRRGKPRGGYDTWTRKKLICAIAEDAGASTRRACELADLSQSTGCRVLPQLEAAGLLRHEGTAKRRRWYATPSGLSLLADVSCQLRISQFDSEGIRRGLVDVHRQSAKLSMALQGARDATRQMRRWGTYSRSIKAAFKYHSIGWILRCLRETRKRAISIRNPGAYLRTILWTRPEQSRGNAAIWCAHRMKHVPYQTRLAFITAAEEDCESVREVFHLANSLKKAGRRRRLDPGDVSGIHGWIQKKIRARAA